MGARVLEVRFSEMNLGRVRLVSHYASASEQPSLPPNEAFQPTSTPRLGRPIGWDTSGVAAAELGCWAA